MDVVPLCVPAVDRGIELVRVRICGVRHNVDPRDLRQHVLRDRRLLFQSEVHSDRLLHQRLLKADARPPAPDGSSESRHSEHCHQHCRGKIENAPLSSFLRPRGDERPLHLPDIPIALLRVKGRAARDHFVQRGRASSRDLRVAVQQPIEQNAQRIDVRPRVRLGIAVLLRRCESLRPECDCIRLVVRSHPGDPVIDEDSLPVRPDHNVLRLDIPVDDRRVHAVQHIQLVA